MRVWAVGDRIQLIVDDQGPGVPAADRKKIFSRFYRGRDTINTTKGVGIGLAIVTEYAASMSGVATVDEAPGGGARFRISFPAVRMFARAAAPVAEGEADVART